MRRPFWSVHNHSLYSSNDALTAIPELVGRAIALEWPAIGLTDHGSVGGLVSFYRACRKQGIEPQPGIELYLARDREARVQGHNLHLTVNAYSETGYRNLCRLVTMTAKRYFHRPLVDLADLAELAEAGHTAGLAVSTGCWFGLVPSVLRHQGEAAAAQVVMTLQRWFPRVYVELQAHGIDQTLTDEQIVAKAVRIQEGRELHLSTTLSKQQMLNNWDALVIDLHKEHRLSEDDMVAALVRVAHRAGAPHIITTDAHYALPGDQPLHDGLKTLCSFSPEPDSARFPGGPYSLFGTADLGTWFEPDVVERSLDALSELAEISACRIPEIDDYKMLVPDVTFGGDPDAELEAKVLAALPDVPDVPAREAAGRLERARSELETVRKTGMPSYLLLVAVVCDEMRARGIPYRVRGSASNFYLNHLAGIASVDAWAHNLRPERFLSEDRIKPPDIDLDIPHLRRAEMERWLGENYVTVKVSTLSRYKLFDEEEDQSKGSLRVRYFATKRAMAAAGYGPAPAMWRDVPSEEKAMLHELAARRLVAGYGQHASGWVLAPSRAEIDRLPLAYIAGTSKTIVTAYPKDDIEDLGLIKLDLIGSKTLTALGITLGSLGMAESDIPLDDPATFKRISEGRTAGMFQLSGWTQNNGVQRLKPKNLNDVITAQALFRPGVSDITGEFMARRKGVIKTPKAHPDIQAETSGTHGLFIYQEQVIGALRRLGMPIAELNALLKAVKASNDYVAGAKVVIQENLPRIRHLAEQRGWAERDVNLILDAVAGYAEYGFNEGHAVAYGTLAVQTGWLATHCPREFWHGMLVAYAKSDDEAQYLRDARAAGVFVMAAHVNQSDVSYRLESGHRVGIRRGLMSIKGVGEVASTEIVAKRGDQPFTSLQDFAQRVLPKRVTGAKALAIGKPLEDCGGIVGALAEYGAFHGLPDKEN